MSVKMPWFRMYVDFLNDPKMISLAFEDQRHFIGILALKSDGALDSVDDVELLDRIVAQRLWIDHGVIRDVKRRLVAAKLIDAEWQPLAWDRRQFVSDRDPTGAERQRRYRDKSRNALRNVHVTLIDTDTDTDTDTESDKESTTPSGKPGRRSILQILLSHGVSNQIAEDFLAQRKSAKASLTVTALEAIKREAGKAGYTLEMALSECLARGWRGFKADWVAGNRASVVRVGNPSRHDLASPEVFDRLETKEDGSVAF